MRKSEELTNPSSCMSRAKNDEMTFVLLGRDAAFPAAVRAWIDERIRLGKNKREDPQIVDAEQTILEVLKEQRTKEIDLDERFPPLDIRCDHKGGNDYWCEECKPRVVDKLSR